MLKKILKHLLKSKTKSYKSYKYSSSDAYRRYPKHGSYGNSHYGRHYYKKKRSSFFSS